MCNHDGPAIWTTRDLHAVIHSVQHNCAGDTFANWPPGTSQAHSTQCWNASTRRGTPVMLVKTYIIRVEFARSAGSRSSSNALLGTPVTTCCVSLCRPKWTNETLLDAGQIDVLMAHAASGEMEGGKQKCGSSLAWVTTSSNPSAAGLP